MNYKCCYDESEMHAMSGAFTTGTNSSAQHFGMETGPTFSTRERGRLGQLQTNRKHRAFGRSSALVALVRLIFGCPFVYRDPVARCHVLRWPMILE
jgi:hypothetical protein